VFAEKASSFLKRMRAYWDAWHGETASHAVLTDGPELVGA
jgi:hypothetical protein